MRVTEPSRALSRRAWGLSLAPVSSVDTLGADLEIANASVTAVRRRVIWDQEGRRRRAADPAWANRRPHASYSMSADIGEYRRTHGKVDFHGNHHDRAEAVLIVGTRADGRADGEPSISGQPHAHLPVTAAKACLIPARAIPRESKEPSAGHQQHSPGHTENHRDRDSRQQMARFRRRYLAGPTPAVPVWPTPQRDCRTAVSLPKTSSALVGGSARGGARPRALGSSGGLVTTPE